MSFTRWLPNRRGMLARHAHRRPAPTARRNTRPRLETLEDRRVLSTLTVTSVADKGAGTLRAEIAAAHNGDTIVFAPCIAGKTITLTKGELLINKAVTITGPGAGSLTIIGNNATRVFEVAAGAQVNISGLTISHGLAKSGNGGGLLVDPGAVLSLSGSALSGNSATHSKRTFQTSLGGGIDNDGTITVIGCTLSGNYATYDSGGGIFITDGTATISGCTLSDNSAVSWGGGIYLFGGRDGATLTITDSTISGNSGNGGGGLYVGSSGTVTVETSSSITGNLSPAGLGADVYNSGVLNLDATSVIGILDGKPAQPI